MLELANLKKMAYYKYFWLVSQSLKELPKHEQKSKMFFQFQNAFEHGDLHKIFLKNLNTENSYKISKYIQKNCQRSKKLP